MTNTLTHADIWLIARLRHEMKRQTNDGTAQPVYWQVMQEEHVSAGDDYADGWKIIDRSGDYTELDSVTELIEHLSEQFFDEYDDDIPTLQGAMLEALSELGDNDLTEAFDIMTRYDYDRRIDYDIVAYRKEDVIKNGPLFLLKEEAKEHIKRNGHHYNSTVHTWGAHAWRSGSFALLHQLLMSDKIIVDHPLTKRYELFCSVVPLTKQLPFDAPDDFLALIKQSERDVLKHLTPGDVIHLAGQSVDIIQNTLDLTHDGAERFKTFATKLNSLSDQDSSCLRPY